MPKSKNIDGIYLRRKNNLNHSLCIARNLEMSKKTKSWFINAMGKCTKKKNGIGIFLMMILLATYIFKEETAFFQIFCVPLMAHDYKASHIKTQKFYKIPKINGFQAHSLSWSSIHIFSRFFKRRSIREPKPVGFYRNCELLPPTAMSCARAFQHKSVAFPILSPLLLFLINAISKRKLYS